MADGIGDILGRAGNHRQLAAQPLHIVERRAADCGDRFHLGAVVADQTLQPLGMFTQTFSGDPAQRIEIAGLRRDKFARKAKLAVDHRQPGFEPGRFGGKQAGGIAKARRLAAAGAQCEQPRDADQQHRRRPRADQRCTVTRGDPGGEEGTIGPAEKAGPACYRQRADNRREPLAGGRTCAAGFAFVLIGPRLVRLGFA